MYQLQRLVFLRMRLRWHRLVDHWIALHQRLSFLNIANNLPISENVAQQTPQDPGYGEISMESILGDADVAAIIARHLTEKELVTFLMAQYLRHLEYLRQDAIRACQEWRWYLAQQEVEANPPEWWETDSVDSNGPPDWW